MNCQFRCSAVSSRLPEDEAKKSRPRRPQFVEAELRQHREHEQHELGRPADTGQVRRRKDRVAMRNDVGAVARHLDRADEGLEADVPTAGQVRPRRAQEVVGRVEPRLNI
eukprot:SAG22_NODE_14_length_33165_cov_13.196698_37_plen_110_part_00